MEDLIIIAVMICLLKKCNIFLFILINVPVGRVAMLDIANLNHNGPGGTYPLIVETAIGRNFNITCYMNPKLFPNRNSSCLHFVIGRTNEVLSGENIAIINSTTITYMAKNATKQHSEYRCQCGTDAIAETPVFVGSLPGPVQNFSCRSFDFDYMICNFTKPSNPVLSTYNVSYYNDFESYVYHPICDYNDRNLVVCNTSLSGRYQEMYHFVITGNNALVHPNEQSSYIQHFHINNFEKMIPAKPGAKIRVENVTVDSIILSWQMVNWEKYRLKGLQWKVVVQPENSTDIQRDDPVHEHNEMRLRLSNLPYAHWNYKLKVRCRVKNPNAIWSDQLVYPFRTAAQRPQRPPRVEPGSFYIDSSETRLTIYWEELSRNEYNGDNFTYVITSVYPDGKPSDLRPWHQEKNLAKFYWRKDLHYEFEIRSRNNKGESSEASKLIIYPMNQRKAKEFTPPAIHNVYHANNRTYTLRWSKPKNLTELSSFTVFWCHTKRALPTECKESIFSQNVPTDQLNFTTRSQNASEERILNLAVSANYYHFNTGLHWSDCSMDIVNTDFVKMEPELTPSANSIKVQWSIGSVCPSILDGFNITYCEVANNVSTKNATCLHELAEKYAKKFYINNLKPFTAYRVTMLMFWRTKKGQPSEPQIITTLEGAPSPPRQLRVEDITNIGATIRWLEPTHSNGKIRKYIIMLNNDQIEVNASTLMYQFENLECCTPYKVYVLAETVVRSKTSNDIHFSTAMGDPTPPGIGPNNNVGNTIQWSKPIKPCGPISFYEVMVTQFHNEEVLRRRISIITHGTSCTFKRFPNCKGAEYKTTVEVRAVNRDPLANNIKEDFYTDEITDIYHGNDELECITNITSKEIYLNSSLFKVYKSPWQTSAIFSCSTSRISKISTLAFVTIAVSLAALTTLYVARNKYNKMANINCTLPAGLETYFNKDSVSGFPANFTGVEQVIKDTRAIEEEWINDARMHDLNVRNEHDHLLASLAGESGYLGGINVADNVLNENILSKNKICEKILPIEKDCDRYERESLNSTATLADSLGSSDSECNNLANFRSNNGFTKQSMQQPWQLFKSYSDISVELPSIPAADNDYITVSNLKRTVENHNKQKCFLPKTEDYVLQKDFTILFDNKLPAHITGATVSNASPPSQHLQQFQSDNYTTLDNLTMMSGLLSQSEINHPNQKHPTEISNADPINIRGLNNAAVDDAVPKPGFISGYVTQHDLNVFAQQQHNC